MDPASVGQVTPARWAIAISLFLARVAIIVYLRLFTGPAHSKPVSAPHQHQAFEATEQRSQQGLSQVNPDKNKPDADIDIIAIHGLDTKSPDTWAWKPKASERRTAKDHACKWEANTSHQQVNWLNHPDMLPKAAGRARILTCDWPADLLQESIPTKLDEAAEHLLNSIRRRPLTTNDPANGDQPRPILFIASCLGGIILLKALERDLSLRKATRGIVLQNIAFRLCPNPSSFRCCYSSIYTHSAKLCPISPGSAYADLVKVV